MFFSVTMVSWREEVRLVGRRGVDAESVQFLARVVLGGGGEGPTAVRVRAEGHVVGRLTIRKVAGRVGACCKKRRSD